MSLYPILSKREKLLAASAAVLLVVFVVIGYTKASAENLIPTVNTKVIQTDFGTPTEKIDVNIMPTPVTPVVDEKQVDANDCKNQQDNLRNWQRNIKDQEREITNLEKETKTTATNARQFLDKFKSCVETLTVCTPDFWNNNNACNDAQRDLQTELQDNLYPLRDCFNNKRNITDRKKERKNLDDQMKDILRNNKTTDVSALTTILTQIDALFVKADATLTCTGTDVDTLKDISSELNGPFQDFYNTSNDVRQASNDARQLAEQARQLADSKRDFEKDKKARCEKDKTREFNNFTKEFNKAKTNGTVTKEAQEAYDNVKATFDKMCVTDLAAMKAALDAGDAQAYNDARSDYDSLDRDFWDALNESRQGVQEVKQKAEQLRNVTRELKNWTRELKRMKSEVAKLKKTYDRTAKKYADKTERAEALVAFKDYVAKAGELVTRIEEGLAQAKKEAPKDPESWWMDHQEDLNDMRQDFNDMQQEIQMIGQVMQTLTQAEKDIVKGTAKELAQLKRESNNDPELMGKLNEIIARAKASITEAWGFAISSPEEAMGVLEGMQDFRQEWEDAKQEWRDARDATQEEENW